MYERDHVEIRAAAAEAAQKTQNQPVIIQESQTVQRNYSECTDGYGAVLQHLKRTEFPRLK